MRRIRYQMAGAALALVALVGADAQAQVQSKDQAKCLTSIAKTARKVSGAVLKDAVQCIRKGAVAGLPSGETADHCLVADLKGKVTKAQTSLAAADSKACSIAAPDFAYPGATTTGDSYAFQNVALSEDSFGLDLDVALAGSDAVDPAGKCSSVLPGALRKLEDAMHRSVETCLKNGLRAGTITANAGFEACYDSITADTRGKVAKAVGLVSALLASKCPSGNLATMFPGLVPICTVYGAGTDAAGIAACSRDRLECRTCLMLNGAYGLDRDCDAFDDTLANGSCPACGNTVIDAGEQCDDGNETSGDGCTATCVDEFCGDSVINDNGAEVCDDGPANSDVTPGACRLNCHPAGCGDGILDSGEQCDDGNTDSGDCCSPTCQYDAPGTSCPGASSTCIAPACDGAGACVDQPSNEGGTCDDGDYCTPSSSCQSGTCTADAQSGVGALCNWVVVGASSGQTLMQTLPSAISNGGDWCGYNGDFQIGSTFSGDLVATGIRSGGPTAGLAILFADLIDVSTGDVVTNNGRVQTSTNLINLPGYSSWTLAPGQHAGKTPSPTFYDTTGTDPRVAQCQSAQSAIATVAANVAALPSDGNFGNAYQDPPGFSSPAPITAVNVGGVNVFDMTHFSGANSNVTMTLDGGGSADTVMVLRISTRLNTGENWAVNLTGGLTPDHVLFYVSKNGGGIEACAIGLGNTGGGTLLCPNMQVHILAGTTWYGAAYGGDSGSTGEIRLEASELIYTPFLPSLP